MCFQKLAVKHNSEGQEEQDDRIQAGGSASGQAWTLILVLYTRTHSACDTQIPLVHLGDIPPLPLLWPGNKRRYLLQSARRARGAHPLSRVHRGSFWIT